MTETTDTTETGRVPQPDDTVTVAAWGGIAFTVIGPETERVYAETEWDLCCDEDETDPDHEHADDCYVAIVDEEGTETTTGRVIVVMVGDDRRWPVEPEDCTPIAPDAYCSCCGQVGCPWGSGGGES